jgi:archaeosine-15-forming tRNA-guanine transglycosylase
VSTGPIPVEERGPGEVIVRTAWTPDAKPMVCLEYRDDYLLLTVEGAQQLAASLLDAAHQVEVLR